MENAPTTRPTRRWRKIDVTLMCSPCYAFATDSSSCDRYILYRRARPADRPFAKQHTQLFISEESTHSPDALQGAQNTMQPRKAQSLESLQPPRIAKMGEDLSCAGLALMPGVQDPSNTGKRCQTLALDVKNLRFVGIDRSPGSFWSRDLDALRCLNPQLDPVLSDAQNREADIQSWNQNLFLNFA